MLTTPLISFRVFAILHVIVVGFREGLFGVGAVQCSVLLVGPHETLSILINNPKQSVDRDLLFARAALGRKSANKPGCLSQFLHCLTITVQVWGIWALQCGVWHVARIYHVPSDIGLLHASHCLCYSRLARKVPRMFTTHIKPPTSRMNKRVSVVHYEASAGILLI